MRISQLSPAVFPRAFAKFCGIALCCAAFSLTSCRFTVPSSNDGQALLASGVFGESVPAWVNQTKQETLQGTDSGIVPSNYSVPSAIKVSREVSNTGVETELREREEQRATEEESEEEALALRADEEASPLDRIEKECPGLESSVSEALLTESRNSRIRKYESLSLRCPTSADLTFWLAKDYEEANRLVEAARSYERTLLLDPSNEAAKALLSLVKEKLNQTSNP